MKGTDLFYPHKAALLYFGIVLFITLILFFIFVKGAWHNRVIMVFASFLTGLLSTGIFLFFALDGLLQVELTGPQERADIAIILGFGYEEDNEGHMKPGRANEELLQWIIEGVDNNELNVETILIQEGVWAAADSLKNKGLVESLLPEGEQGLKIITKNKKVIVISRIHKHHANVYVNTFNTLYLAAGRIRKTKQRNVLLVAHDLQLQRSIFAWNRAAETYAESFAGLKLVVPHFKKQFPGSWGSVQLWTKSRIIYKFAELLIRVLEGYELLTDQEMDRVRMDGQNWY